MLHELKAIFLQASQLEQQGQKSALVTVVALKGSSYRRPGVRMLVAQNGEMTGAVSGGCVEKEIVRQAQEVFSLGVARVLRYDGRYRLGCEGILTILIEPITKAQEICHALLADFNSRTPVSVYSYYQIDAGANAAMGSIFEFSNNKQLAVNLAFNKQNTQELSCFKQQLAPAIRLVIVGAEHDAVALCKAAANMGMTVAIIAPLDDPKNIKNFPGASGYHGLTPEEITSVNFDARTALVIMTHSFSKDLQYLGNLIGSSLGYIGLLGPKKRREQLLNDLLEYFPAVSDSFLDDLFGPAGINIGAESAQEIAVSILAEILATMRNQQPGSLKYKQGGIHD